MEYQHSINGWELLDTENNALQQKAGRRICLY